MDQIAPLNSVNDTKRLLGLGHTKLYELIGAGALDARKLSDGGKTLITGDSIRAFIDGLPKADIGRGRFKGAVRD